MGFPSPFILAHGALGWWDELIFLGIIIIFGGIMIYSWFMSRDDDFESADLMPKVKNTDSVGEERFELE